MSLRPQRRRRWIWRGMALLLVLLAGGYFSRGYFHHFRKSHPPNAFFHVQRADMLISVTEEGALRALNETVVRSSLEGFNRIIHIVPEGAYVEKGDLLVELDSSGLKDRLNEQELQHQDRLFQTLQAKGNLNIQKSLVESQIKEAELKVENAQVDFEKYRDADAPLLIKTVEARSSVLSEQVRIARERFTRTEELFKAGNATKSEVEADALSLKREQLALGQYQEDLRLIQKYDRPNQLRLLQSNFEQAQAELVRLKQRTSNELAQAEADLKTSQGALEFMEEGIETLRQRLASTKILAPQNGLVVYAPVSPFQSAGNDDRRGGDGRSRLGGGRGGGQAGGGGEFRGGGRRGGRGNSSSENSSSGGSSAAETLAGGNQRIASAVSGTAATGSSAAGDGGSAAGGRSGGGSGGSSGGGQNASSAAGAFVSYPSMRPSSLFGAATATGAAAKGNTGGGSGTSASSGASGSSATEGQSAAFNANQLGFRSSSQNFRDFGYEMSGTPGVLEAGIMVRQRQELIRLPDVSKMLAEINIEESRVRQVRSGMTALIRVKNIPHRQFKGTVRRVALLPDAQASWMNPDKKVFPADILVEEELPILKPGVSASVEIIITNLTKVLSVPIQTVARLEGMSMCFIKNGSRVTPVPVTTGYFNDAFVEITSGLKEGDFVLLAPMSDEEEGAEESESGDTNHSETATPLPRTPPGGEPAEGRRTQSRNSESVDSEAPPERPRTRPGQNRRLQTSPNAPE